MPYPNASTQPPSSSVARSPEAITHLVPSFWLLLIYWCLGLIVGLLYLHPEELTLHRILGWQHGLSMALGLAVTLGTNRLYRQISEHRGRVRDRFTLFFFSIFNGMCETLLFLASFKLGATLAAAYTQNPIWIFSSGFMMLFCYLGAIHAFFWIKILPPHLNRDPQLKGIRRGWMLGLLLMTLLWAWLFHRYQDFWTVAFLHVLVDGAMVQSIHYSLLRQSQSGSL